MKNNILSFLKGVLSGIVFLAVGYYLINFVLNHDRALSELGSCIVEQSIIDGNTSTPQQLWDTYAEFCKEFIEKKNVF